MTIKRKTYRNFMYVMNRIQAKGYTFEEAERMTHRVFDDYEAQPEGLGVLARVNMIIDKAEWENAR